jgi:hypothetical protein
LETLLTNDDYQNVNAFLTEFKNNYRVLATLPDVLEKYNTGIRTISRGARKIENGEKVKDEEVLNQSIDASKKIRGYKKSVEDILDDGRIFSGLTTKIDKLGSGISESNWENKKKKFSKDYAKIAKDMKNLFSRIEFIKGYNLKLGEAINCRPFEKLEKELYQ